MRTFLLQLALTYVATALLLSAAGHLASPRDFGRLVRQHGIVPAALALPVAVLVLVLELALGTGAAVQAAAGGAAAAAALLAGAALLGASFALYLRRLLRTAGAATPCGCSPLPGRLTSASYLPALGLSGAASCGWAAAVSGTPAAMLGVGSAAGLLPVLWGLTLATAVALVPSTVPGGLPGTEVGHG